jgi:hypothetical protein
VQVCRCAEGQRGRDVVLLWRSEVQRRAGADAEQVQRFCRCADVPCRCQMCRGADLQVHMIWTRRCRCAVMEKYRDRGVHIWRCCLSGTKDVQRWFRAGAEVRGASAELLYKI